MFLAWPDLDFNLHVSGLVPNYFQSLQLKGERFLQYLVARLIDIQYRYATLVLVLILPQLA